MYDLVNNISSVGYKVNKDVFDFLTVYGFEYELLMDSKDKHPLMDKEKLTKIEHLELSSYLSKLGLQENILGLADVLLNIHEFFIPVRVDPFGRLYCISEYLNYQSTELAKSLLLFSKGEKLDKSDKVGISYLKAYGANCFGNKLDKKSWNDRIK
jgi:DNA-directed RNA polymerase